MALDKENITNDIPGGKPVIDWKSSSEEQWAMLIEKMEEKPRGRQILFNRPFFKYAVAAAISLLVVAGAFLRFSQTTYSTGNAERLSIELPDGSIASLNAGSELSLNTYWWWAEREVKLTGEAYFEVEKGEKFTVFSERGLTEVLGTKFNVFARGESYKVTCLEGSVGVSLTSGNTVKLSPNETAILIGSSLSTEKVEKPENEISWTNNYYIFTAADIAEVIDELQRQYNVSIDYRGEPAKYTGSFQQEMSIDQVLNILSRTMELQIEKTGEDTYTLK